MSLIGVLGNLGLWKCSECGFEERFLFLPPPRCPRCFYPKRIGEVAIRRNRVIKRTRIVRKCAGSGRIGSLSHTQE